MRNLTDDDVREAKTKLTAGVTLEEVVPAVLGGTLLDGGFWRLFAPGESDLLCLATWNAPNLWKSAWNGLASLAFWGEDVFGNQLLLDPRGDVLLWNHEDASVVGIGFDLITIAEVCLHSGLGWIDYYSDGSYALAMEMSAGLTLKSHWHWTQPRIMGGTVTRENLSQLERVQHLTGHGQLWSQIRAVSQ